ncbi:Sulfotransferase family cytosolic 1B member 1 [Holothuria leucospilota]|uniref:Sulfotransferase family cytosolic 1B member 1 n=1 Tax=Holothuria leucospilota TaxID=206669 RepID=A0A9Q0YRV9_HOLLE|nr:Sulfotransferase family cytosolic 1B member 1 [Holothuria leucospilota]
MQQTMSANQETSWPEVRDFVKEKSYLYNGYVMPKVIAPRYLKDIADFKVRPDDVYLLTYPKSGTTWAQNIICLILETRGRKADEHLSDKVQYLEFPEGHGSIPRDVARGMYEVASTKPSPRVLKSHLRVQFLPTELHTKKPKIVYVARNPKDSAVSFFNFCSFSYNCPPYRVWSDFFLDFCKGTSPRGSWFDSVLPWWKKRHEPNVLFLKYEDMQKDLRGSVLKIANFLEYKLSDDQVDNIVAKSTFKAMKTDPMVNPDSCNPSYQDGVKQNKSFMRKGKVGDWKNYFTVAQNEQFDDLYERMTHGTGLVFDYFL